MAVSQGDQPHATALEHFEIQQLLINEAYVLDERRYDKWLTFFTEDVHYWMPIRLYTRKGGSAATISPEAELTGPRDLSLFDETIKTLALRVARLKTGKAWAEEPPSRTRRLITNVNVVRNGSEWDVMSYFAIYQGRAGGEPMTFYGRRDDVVRRVGEDLKIAKRRVYLDSELHHGNMSIFF